MTVGESRGEPHLVINMHRSILPRAGGYQVNCDCSSWLLGFFVTGRRRRPKTGARGEGYPWGADRNGLGPLVGNCLKVVKPGPDDGIRGHPPVTARTQ